MHVVHRCKYSPAVNENEWMAAFEKGFAGMENSGMVIGRWLLLLMALIVVVVIVVVLVVLLRKKKPHQTPPSPPSSYTTPPRKL